jgi:hypothetical protein
LLIAQPKQVVAHDPNPLPKTNQDRIVRAEKLMSSDPNHLTRRQLASATASSAPPTIRQLKMRQIGGRNFVMHVFITSDL